MNSLPFISCGSNSIPYRSIYRNLEFAYENTSFSKAFFYYEFCDISDYVLYVSIGSNTHKQFSDIYDFSIL